MLALRWNDGEDQSKLQGLKLKNNIGTVHCADWCLDNAEQTLHY